MTKYFNDKMLYNINLKIMTDETTWKIFHIGMSYKMYQFIFACKARILIFYITSVKLIISSILFFYQVWTMKICKSDY